MSLDHLTLLRCKDGYRAHKTYTHVEGGAPSVVSYDAGTMFDVKSLPVSSFAELAHYLPQVAKMRECLLVRGAVKEGVTGAVRRKVRGADADMEEVPRRWLMLDIDGAQLPSLHEAVRLVGLSDYSYVWHYSASAGVKPGLSAHVFFWLDRACTTSELTTWSQDWGMEVDTAVFRPVQPLFVADPEFVDMPDPIGERWGVVQGSSGDTVPVPQLPDRDQYGADRLSQIDRYYRNCLHNVEKAKTSNRRNSLHKAAYCLGGLVPHLYTEQKVRRELLAAVGRGGGWGDLPEDTFDGHMTNGIESGMEHPLFVWSGWKQHANWETSETGSETVLTTVITAMAILEHHPQFAGRLALDARAGIVMLDEKPMIDSAVTLMVQEIWQAEQLEFKSLVLNEAIVCVAQQFSFDPVRKWMEGLAPWDGVDRLTGIFPSEQPAAYVEEVVKCWLVSAVARVMEPGCRADHVLILQGAQGWRKTSAWQALSAPCPVYEASGHLGDVDTTVAAHRSWLVEFSELASMKKGEIEHVKSWITRGEDRIRAKYARNAQDMPRRFVCCGSTNSDVYLTDTTGNRRFWNLELSSPIDIDALIKIVPQVWAQALSLYQDGTPWWLDAEGSARAAVQQEAVREADSIEDALDEILDNPRGSTQGVYSDPGLFLSTCGRVAAVTSSSLLSELDEKAASAVGRRVSAEMRRRGWTKQRSTRTGNLRVWTHPEREIAESSQRSVDCN